MSLALIVDFGTTNTKAGVVDPQGKILAHANCSVNLKRPEKGAVEHDPTEIINNFLNLSKKVVKGYENDISVLSLSAYQFGFMPVDKNEKPLTGMITLLDTRSKLKMENLEQKVNYQKIYEKTGCPPLFTYIFTRLAWLQENKPDIFAKSAYFHDLKSYLLSKICNAFITEPGIASSSQLFNIHDLDWDEELLNLVGIKKEQLPEIVSGEQVIGTLNKTIAAKLGLKTKVKVIPGFYDGGSLIVGMGGYDADANYGVCNMGTTAMLRTSIKEVQMDSSQKKRLQTYALNKERWAIGGALNNAGVALRWFRDNLGGDKSYQELDQEAKKISPCADGLFCLPFLTGERDPRIGSLASASFFGLKEYHTQAHLTRAILEGVGFGLNMVKQVLDERKVKISTIRLGGSGSNSPLWPQILADIFNTPVQKSLTEDATLIGSAILAFTAMGEYDSIKVASQTMVKTGEIFSPIAPNVKSYHDGFAFFLELKQRFKELYTIHAQRFSDV